MTRSALLVLADGRFPAGGHAHSGGAEAAVRAGRLKDAADLEGFCRGRLHTADCRRARRAAALGHDPAHLDAAADARTASPALRAASRRLGRQLLRASRATWPCPALDALARAYPRGAHQPVVLGATARAAGLGARDAAHCAAYETVSGPRHRGRAAAQPRPPSRPRPSSPGWRPTWTPSPCGRPRPPREGVDALPAASAPLLDITAEQHAAWPVRLFAS